MDMLSRCRKHQRNKSPENKRKNPCQKPCPPTDSVNEVYIKKNQKTGDKCLSNIESSVGSQQAISESQNGNIILRVLANSGAKQNAVTEIADKYIGVEVSALAREGRANVELVYYLASILGIRRTYISIETGLRSRIKSVMVTKNGLTVDTVKNLLEQRMRKDVD